MSNEKILHLQSLFTFHAVVLVVWFSSLIIISCPLLNVLSVRIIQPTLLSVFAAFGLCEIWDIFFLLTMLLPKPLRYSWGKKHFNVAL